jgi:hypothetical protein
MTLLYLPSIFYQTYSLTKFSWQSIKERGRPSPTPYLCHACAIFLLERTGAKGDTPFSPKSSLILFGDHESPHPDDHKSSDKRSTSCWLQPVFLMSLHTTPLFWYLSIALKIYRKFYRFIIITFLE